MKTQIRSDSGQTLVLVALMIIVLLGVAALAIDVGSLYGERRNMQNAADAAALAGAGELCLGRTYEQANDMAVHYAVVRNDADQAFPVPTVAGNLRSMTVTVQKTANHFFARIFTSGSSEVMASATARCERTGSGCGTWPETVKQDKFRNLGCNVDFYISLSNDECNNTTHYCDNIFTATSITTEQRGWFSPTYNCNASSLANLLTEEDFPPVPIRSGQCIGGQPGADVGVPGGNGGNVTEWRNEHPDHRALIPLFDCYGETAADNCISPWDGACVRSGGCAGEYLVSGFGCMEPKELVKNYEIPERTPTAPKVKITAIRATVRCDCTISCGSGGGLPEPGDAMIPVLIQ